MIYDEESTGRLDARRPTRLGTGLVFWRQVILESDRRFDNLRDTNQKEITKPTTRGSRCVIWMQFQIFSMKTTTLRWRRFDVFWQKVEASVCQTRRISECPDVRSIWMNASSRDLSREHENNTRETGWASFHKHYTGTESCRSDETLSWCWLETLHRLKTWFSSSWNHTFDFPRDLQDWRRWRFWPSALSSNTENNWCKTILTQKCIEQQVKLN